MKYRKKPIVVEAFQWNPEYPVPEWFIDAKREGAMLYEGDHLFFVTPGGTMTAQDGDWIIKGVKGEFYPCKPDIFAATYEPAE